MKKQNRFKSSIKWRFTFIFMGLIAVLFIAILMANSFLLEGYYTMQKVSTLENAYTTLDTMLGSDEAADDRIDLPQIVFDQRFDGLEAHGYLQKWPGREW